ncbi:MAG: VanZ family protein, partial [Planctomycetota bacterium]
ARSRWFLTETGARAEDFSPRGLKSAAQPAGWGIKEADLSAMGVGALFAALGFFLALGGREQSQARRACFDLALVHAGILALLIEVMQFFVASGSFDMVDLLLSVMAAALGAYLAVYAVDAPSRSCWLGRPEIVFSPLLITIALLLQVAYHALWVTWALQYSGTDRVGTTVIWIPFSAHYCRPLGSVLTQMLSVAAGAGLLAFTVAGLVRRLGRRGAWLFAALAVVAVTGLREAVQAVSTVHVAEHLARYSW